MKVGIISAMPIELETIRGEMEVSGEERIGGITFTEGHWADTGVVVSVGGIGKVNAAMGTQAMLQRFHPDIVINTGVAGGIAPGLSLLDVVIADRVAQHDVDTSPIGDPVGMVSGINLIHIPCDMGPLAAGVRTMAEDRTDTRIATIASGDQFIADPARADEIGRRFGAAAVDMESGAIGQVCYINGVPCCIIRALSDSGDGMEYGEFVGRAAEKSVAILRALLQNA